MGARRVQKLQSIDHALQVLNEAADESGEEIRDLVSNDYRRIRGIFNDATPKIKTAFTEMKKTASDSMVHAKDRIVESGREGAQAIDKSAHENPWAFIGTTALCAGVTGFLLGRKGNESKRVE